jgi:PhnB protein
VASIIPYINFENKSQEAVKFYKAVFGGDAELQLDAGRVIQLEFEAGDIHFMGSDMEGNQPNLVLLDYHDKLVAGGKEVFAPTDSGWGAVVAHCVDKFGVNWMLNYDKA